MHGNANSPLWGVYPISHDWLKKDGLIESNRHNNWVIYPLSKKALSALKAH